MGGRGSGRQGEREAAGITGREGRQEEWRKWEAVGAGGYRGRSRQEGKAVGVGKVGGCERGNSRSSRQRDQEAAGVVGSGSERQREHKVGEWETAEAGHIWCRRQWGGEAWHTEEWLQNLICRKIR